MDQRFYTFTMKPTLTKFKGDELLLRTKFNCFLIMIKGSSVDTMYEDVGSKNVHLHALIKCPYIASKSTIASFFHGFHLCTDLIKKPDEINVKYIWYAYTHKTKRDSASDRYHYAFGNSFL